MKLYKNTFPRYEKLQARVLATVCTGFFLLLFEKKHIRLKLILGLLFCVACFISKAQLPEYYVYLIKGSATKKDVSGKSRKIKQHDLLYHHEILFLKTGAELTLVDTDDSFILLKSAGKHKVDNLKNYRGEDAEGLTKKYLKLLWHELLEPAKDYTVFKNENLAELSGSVSRGRKTCDNQIFPVDKMKTSEDSIHFTWLQNSNSGVYDFTISGPSDKKLELPVSDTQYTVRISDFFGQEPGRYYWQAKGKNTPEVSTDSACRNKAMVYFDLITKEEEARLVSSLVPQDLPNDLSMQLSIIDKLEKNTLIYSAINFYSTIIKAHPGDTALLKGFIFFLLKYGFNDEALLTWNNLKNN